MKLWPPTPGLNHRLMLALVLFSNLQVRVEHRYREADEHKEMKLASTTKSSILDLQRRTSGHLEKTRDGKVKPTIHPFQFRVANISTLQKDLNWNPPNGLECLVGKAGPTLLTSQRQGQFGLTQSQNPRQNGWSMNTKNHRRQQYAMGMSVEGSAMGFALPE
mmetsp:Transcript_4289/g.6798  ORF Transcript_4289/g.6798 Transcript_4289/m.6798 type:complete len:162 (-) Transcript_4289:1441-1926(-)